MDFMFDLLPSIYLSDKFTTFWFHVTYPFLLPSDRFTTTGFMLYTLFFYLFEGFAITDLKLDIFLSFYVVEKFTIKLFHNKHLFIIYLIEKFTTNYFHIRHCSCVLHSNSNSPPTYFIFHILLFLLTKSGSTSFKLDTFFLLSCWKLHHQLVSYYTSLFSATFLTHSAPTGVILDSLLIFYNFDQFPRQVLSY